MGRFWSLPEGSGAEEQSFSRIFIRRPMSVLMARPERQPFPSDESRSEQQLSTLYRCRRFVCALILVLTDLSTIAVSLSLAIFLRNHLMPRVSSNLHIAAFPFRHYL